MRLEMRLAAVSQVRFGSATEIADRCLSVAREELCARLAADPRLAEVDIELANPGEDCRITDIFDVFEPRYKPDGPNFPGVLEPIRRAGSGATAVARGAAVMVLNGAADDPYKRTIDMRGPIAHLSPYARTANVCIRSRPADGIKPDAYHRALKEAGVKTSIYLGQAASRASTVTSEIFELDMHAPRATRPRVAYIFMIASQQRPTTTDPVLYGDNVRQFLPALLHPNEVLDGAVLAPYWNFGGDTFTVQNHPMVLELYRRHGRELDFAGVIAVIAAEVDEARTRSAVLASGLARHALDVDAVLLTKYGGGIPESATMETFEACDELGVKGVIVIWIHGGDGRIEGSLTAISPRADALVSCGNSEENVDLPPVARVIAASPDSLVLDCQNIKRPAAGPVRLRFLNVAGAADQLGGSLRSSEEY